MKQNNYEEERRKIIKFYSNDEFSEMPIKPINTNKLVKLNKCLLKYHIADDLGMHEQKELIRNEINMEYIASIIKEKFDCKLMTKKDIEKVQEMQIVPATSYSNNIIPFKSMLYLKQVENVVKESKQKAGEINADVNIESKIAFTPTDPILFISINSGSLWKNFEINRWEIK